MNNESTNLNHDEKALTFLKKDFSLLLKGIEGKTLEEINLDAIIQYLEILKTEVSNVKDGIRANDNFVSHSISPEDEENMFSNSPRSI